MTFVECIFMLKNRIDVTAAFPHYRLAVKSLAAVFDFKIALRYNKYFKTTSMFLITYFSWVIIFNFVGPFSVILL